MSVVAIEGVVEGGRILLKDGTQLPERTRVFVVVPDAPAEKVDLAARIRTPRLAHPEQVVDFRMEVTEEPREKPSAGV